MQTSDEVASPAVTGLAVALSFAVSFGFLDVILSLVSAASEGPWGLALPAVLAAAIGAGAVIALALYTVAWGIFVRPLARLRQIPAPTLELAVASFLLTGLVLIRPLGVYSATGGAELVIAWASLAGVAIGSGFMVFAAVRAMGGSRLPMACVVAAPFVWGFACAVLWTDTLHALGSDPLGRASLALKLGLPATLLLLWFFARKPRPRTSVVLLAGLFGTLLCGATIGVRATNPPGRASPPAEGFHHIRHVILITVDTLRASALSCHGYEAIRTPHIDAFAQDGIRFARAISPAPWTLPSLASLITGLSPSAHRATAVDARLPDAVGTLAETMRAAGYATGARGDSSFLTARYNLGQGFEDYRPFAPMPLGRSLGAQVIRRVFRERFREHVSTATLTEKANTWLRENARRDFFFWIHYQDPHEPYAPPEKFRPPGPAPARIGWRLPDLEPIRVGTFVPSLDERRWIRSLYDGEVRLVDAAIGDLIATLKELGIYEDALIVLTSDHGEEFWEHGSVSHAQTLYGEVLHVPLIFKLPGSSVRRRVDEAASIVGIVPTILELAKLPYDPADYSQRSLVPLWAGGDSASRHTVVVSEANSYFEPRIAVELHGMKYIRDLAVRHEELFDLTQDPLESAPLNSVPPALRREIDAALEEYAATTDRVQQRHGIAAARHPLDRGTIEVLRGLGYVQ